MYNCVIVVVNGRRRSIFQNMDHAEMYRQSLQQQFAHLGLQINCDWAYIPDSANERLLKHFETKNLKGFGVENLHSFFASHLQNPCIRKSYYPNQLYCLTLH